MKNKLVGLRCIEHNQVTTVEINGDKISFKCCCDSVKRKAELLIQKTTKDFIESELRKAIKGR